MIIGIGKLGKSVQFDSGTWGAIGGDNEAPIMFENMITKNPEHKFMFLGVSDFDRLPIKDQERINVHNNIINPWDNYSEWCSTVYQPALKRGDYDGKPGMDPGIDKMHADGSRYNGMDRMHYLEQFIIPKMNSDYHIDCALLMAGPMATTNIRGRARLLKEYDTFSKPLKMTARYVGPIAHYLNLKQTPWAMILNDPRLYPGRLRDLFNPPKKILSQYDHTCDHVCAGGYDDPVYKSNLVKATYSKVETTFLIGKKRGEVLEPKKNTLEAFFDDSTIEEGVKDIKFMIVCNEGRPSRYPDLKKYILDNVEDVDIYGQWNKATIGDDKRFKGPKMFDELQVMLPRVKYTFCIPIKKGWVTAKFWEMAHYGIIPFLHPTYDEQKHLNIPDFLRVKDSKDLFEKIKFLEETPKAYDELREVLDDVLRDSFYDGTYMNNLLMDTANEIR